MSKLLEVPRVPKDIQEIKKKKRFKKTESEKQEIKYTLLKEGNKSRVLELIRIYKDDPFKCRVKFFNAKQKYYFDRLVLFEKDNNDFEISEFVTSFGISITNRMYSSQKKIHSIIYKGGKFYYINKLRRKISPLTWGHLCTFMQDTENVNVYGSGSGNYEKLMKSKTYAYLVEKFPFIRVLSEHPYSMGVNLNVAKQKKLTSLKDLNRHIFKVPNNIALVMIESGALNNITIRNDGSIMRAWVDYMKYLDGIQNLKVELVKSHYFFDTLKMAKTLGRKVNCRWNEKRLKEEHDKWAREIGYIVLDCETEYDLKIKPEYIALQKYTGWELLTTNKMMIIEGMTQDHCVGTYIDRVDRGECAIFHVEGYTLQVGLEDKDEKATLLPLIRSMENRLELTYDDDDKNAVHAQFLEHIKKRFKEIETETPKRNRFFKNMQFRGKHNSDPSVELKDRVNDILLKFTTEGKFEELYKRLELENQIDKYIDKDINIPIKLHKRQDNYFLDDIEIPTDDLAF